MIVQDVKTITLVDGGTYTFPSTFKSIDKLVYTSADSSVFDPTFKDDGVYALTGNQITYDSQYTGTVDQYYTYDDGVNTVISATQWTLDQLYQEVGAYIDADPSTYLEKDGGGNYVDTISFNRVRSALNRAKNQISRDKFQQFKAQGITLNDSLLIDTASLAKPFTSVKRTLDSSGNEVDWEWAPDNKIKCLNSSIGDVITLEYFYTPADLVALADVLDFPENIVDPRILCYFAAYMYFIQDGNQRKANFWLASWNDGFENIHRNRGEVLQIKNVYGNW